MSMDHSSSDIHELQEKLNSLSKRFSSLSTLHHMYTNLAKKSGLQDILETISMLFMDFHGCNNIKIYYYLDNVLFEFDLSKKQKNRISGITDELVLTSIEKGEINTREVGKESILMNDPFASIKELLTVDISFPLKIASITIGAIKLENTLLYPGHTFEEVQTFLNYAALTLFNELNKETRILRAYSELENIFDANPDGMYVIDNNFTITRINNSLKHMLQLSKERILGLKCYDLFAFPHCNKNSCPVFDSFNNDEIFSMETTCTVSSGDTFPCRVTANALRIGEEIHGAVVNLANISALKQSESEKEESRKKYQLLFEKITNGFALHKMIYDDKGKPSDYKFIEVNPEFERLTGLKANAILGKTVKEVIPGIESSWIEKYGKVAKNGTPLQFQNYAEPLDKYYNVSAFQPEKDHFACVFNDITDSIKDSQRLNKLNNCFLNFSNNPLENFQLLTQTCGELLNADSAFYNRLSGNALKCLGAWNQPADFEIPSVADGHICADVIKLRQSVVFIAYDLQNSEYYYTDPAVKRYGLSTYIGFPVKLQDKIIGTVCCLYTSNMVPSDKDLDTLKIIASALSTEEERMTASLELEKSESKFRQIIESADDSILIAEQESLRFVSSNPAASRLFGHSHEDFLKLTVPDIHPESIQDKLAEKTIALKSSGSEKVFDMLCKRKDGTVFFADIFASIISYGNKNFIMSVIRDTTEKKEQNEKLLALQHILKTRTEVNRAIIRSKKEDEFLTEVCKILVSSDYYHFAWVGYAQNDTEKTIIPVSHWGTSGYHIDSIHIRWDDSPQGNGPAGRAIKTGKSQVSQNIPDDPCLLPWKENARESSFKSSIAVPLKHQQGTFGSLNIYSEFENAFFQEEITMLEDIAHDIEYGVETFRIREKQAAMESEHKEMQNQLFLTAKLASIGELAAGVAHEINNPLSIILAYNEFLEQELKGNEIDKDETDHCILKQKKAIQRITDIVNGLRIYSRTNLNESEVFDVHDVITLSIDMLETIYKKDDIRFETSLKAADSWVSANQGKLQQVLMNLFSNARDALKSFDEGIVRVSTLNRDNKIILSVADNGQGIESSKLERIFDTFFTTKKQGEGTGLGLSLTQSIINEMKGTIKAESKQGMGATFVITLPFTTRKQKAIPTKSKLKHSKKISGSVLLVEDEEEICLLLKDSLISIGLNVDTAFNGKEALELLKTNSYDYLITDMKMPGLSGDQLIWAGKKLGLLDNTKIIITTGGMMIEYSQAQRKMIEDEADAYIPKPISLKKLVSTLEKLKDEQ